jgi:hypothetical protein
LGEVRPGHAGKTMGAEREAESVPHSEGRPGFSFGRAAASWMAS